MEVAGLPFAGSAALNIKRTVLPSEMPGRFIDARWERVLEGSGRAPPGRGFPRRILHASRSRAGRPAPYTRPGDPNRFGGVFVFCARGNSDDSLDGEVAERVGFLAPKP